MRIVVMGVSGSGKSTLGAAMADALGAVFVEGDGLHPPENVAHMAAGKPLDDDMRWPWLQACGAELAGNDPIVLACSALKRSYRNLLRVYAPDVVFVYPKVDAETIRARMEARTDHYMPTSLLDSQLATLEEPEKEEAPIVVDASGSIEDMVKSALYQL